MKQITTVELEIRREAAKVGQVTRYGAFLNGSKVGAVYSRRFTVEQSSRGRTYVNSRRESRTVEWRAELLDGRDCWGRFASRKRAVEVLTRQLEATGVPA